MCVKDCKYIHSIIENMISFFPQKYLKEILKSIVHMCHADTDVSRLLLEKL